MKRRRLSPTSSSSCSSSSSCINEHQVPKPKRSSRPHNKNITLNSNQNAAAENTRRSSIYRGVTRHRWTGRFEAHLWDKGTWNNIQNKKGKQRAYDSEEAAARTYDLAALKYWGQDTTLNFEIDTYKKEIEEMEKLSKDEYLASLRRRSSGFSRGVSKYRGVARHHHNGRWEARIGRVLGNKYLYLGTYTRSSFLDESSAVMVANCCSILVKASDAAEDNFAEESLLVFDFFFALSLPMGKVRGGGMGRSSSWSSRIGHRRAPAVGVCRWQTPPLLPPVPPPSPAVNSAKSVAAGRTQEEAAAAYDLAAIEYRGAKAVTNFDISIYTDRLKDGVSQIQSTPDQSTEVIASFINEQKEEVDHHDLNCQPPPQQQQQEETTIVAKEESLHEMHDLDFPPSVDEEHPWSLCMDSSYNFLPVPHIPLDKSGDLLDLFHDIGFEDDIDIIFDGSFSSGNELEKVHACLTSPSSSSSLSSLSTTTSLSCPSSHC
ncbi:hypothetical protein LXL04_014208 [Taraxacum kok-saghyz]